MSNTKTEAQRLADELVHEATKRVCNVAMMPYSLPIDAAKELRRLDAENQQLKTSLALVQQHHATAWNRGHQAGLMAGKSAVKQATDAVKADAWGNTQLTNALMQAEAERDQLQAQLAKAVAEEREACAKVCEYQADRFMQASPLEGNKPYASHECAAAIRARSNA